METFDVNGLAAGGISTDRLPWTLPPNFLTQGVNFRTFAEFLASSGGANLWSTAPVNFFPALPFHVGSTSGDYWLIMGRDAIYAFDGGTWTDVSSVEGYANILVNQELLWTACMLGGIPVVSNPQAQPEYWSPQQISQVMQPLMFDPGNTWNDLQYGAQIFRSHRNFLFALNLVEGNDLLHDSYRWSHPADINGLPVTWDETDPAYLAGKAALGGDGGRIIDGLSLRDAFCMYSERSIDVLDYTADEFVWRRRNLSSTTGLMSKQSIIEIKGTHFLLTPGDIVSNDGNSIKSIAHDRIRKKINTSVDINNYDRCYAVRNNKYKEIWFCVPEPGETYPTLAFIYNWKDDSFSIRDLDRDVAISNYGSQSSPIVTWDDLLDSQIWANQNNPWGSSGNSPLDDTIVGADPVNGSLYLMDPDEANNLYTTTLERTDLNLTGDGNVTTLTRAYPRIIGDGEVRMTFGSQDYPGGPVRWGAPIEFVPDDTRKLDFRTTGVLHCWKLRSTDGRNFRFSGMALEYQMAGTR